MINSIILKNHHAEIIYHNILLIFLFFSLLIFCGGTAYARGKTLTLEEACKIGLKSSPLIKQAKAVSEGAEAEVNRAISAFLPRIDLELGYSHSNKPPQVFTDKLNQQEFSASDFVIDRLNDPGYRDNWGTRFVFTQPIFNQGREYTGYKIAQKGREMAAIHFDGTVQTLLYMLEKAYYQAILAGDAVRALKQASETAMKHEELTQARYKKGMVLKSDTLSAMVQRTETERELIQAENNYMVAMASLNKVMGTSMDMTWELQDDEVSKPSEEREIGYWMNLARHNRSDLLAARKQLEIARDTTQQAKLRYLPSINLHAIYDNNRNNIAYSGGDDWTLMASASFNIFNGLGDRAAVASATAKTKEAEAAVKESETRTELEVRKAFYNLQNAEKQLDVMKRSVEQAQESLRIISKRYSNGLALVVELLAADTTLKKEKLREARARFDLRLARTALKWSAGILGRETVSE